VSDALEFKKLIIINTTRAFNIDFFKLFDYFHQFFCKIEIIIVLCKKEGCGKWNICGFWSKATMNEIKLTFGFCQTKLNG